MKTKISFLLVLFLFASCEVIDLGGDSNVQKSDSIKIEGVISQIANNLFISSAMARGKVSLPITKPVEKVKGDISLARKYDIKPITPTEECLSEEGLEKLKTSYSKIIDSSTLGKAPVEAVSMFKSSREVSKSDLIKVGGGTSTLIKQDFDGLQSLQDILLKTNAIEMNVDNEDATEACELVKANLKNALRFVSCKIIKEEMDISFAEKKDLINGCAIIYGYDNNDKLAAIKMVPLKEDGSYEAEVSKNIQYTQVSGFRSGDAVKKDTGLAIIARKAVTFLNGEDTKLNADADSTNLALKSLEEVRSSGYLDSQKLSDSLEGEYVFLQQEKRFFKEIRSAVKKSFKNIPAIMDQPKSVQSTIIGALANKLHRDGQADLIGLFNFSFERDYGNSIDSVPSENEYLVFMQALIDDLAEKQIIPQNIVVAKTKAYHSSVSQVSTSGKSGDKVDTSIIGGSLSITPTVDTKEEEPAATSGGVLSLPSRSIK